VWPTLDATTKAQLTALVSIDAALSALAGELDASETVPDPSIEDAPELPDGDDPTWWDSHIDAWQTAAANCGITGPGEFTTTAADASNTPTLVLPRSIFSDWTGVGGDLELPSNLSWYQGTLKDLVFMAFRALVSMWAWGAIWGAIRGGPASE
jgi:hypothetical protein